MKLEHLRSMALGGLVVAPKSARTLILESWEPPAWEAPVELAAWFASDAPATMAVADFAIGTDVLGFVFDVRKYLDAKLMDGDSSPTAKALPFATREHRAFVWDVCHALLSVERNIAGAVRRIFDVIFVTSPNQDEAISIIVAWRAPTLEQLIVTKGMRV